MNYESGHKILVQGTKITMSAEIRAVNILSHEGKYVGVHNLKVTLRTGTEKTTVEYGRDNWRCESVRFKDNGDVDALDLVFRDERGIEMNMTIGVDQLWFRNVECLDSLFRQLGIAFFRYGRNKIRRTATLCHSRENHRAYLEREDLDRQHEDPDPDDRSDDDDGSGNDDDDDNDDDDGQGPIMESRMNDSVVSEDLTEKEEEG